MEAVGHPYPAALDIQSPERIARWRPLVQWLLAIPHLVVVWLLGYVSGVISIISWIVVLITGKLPSSLAGIQAMYLRYSNRVTAYAGFLKDEYPPFSFDTATHDPGDYPGETVDFEPELENRNRLTVLIRILMVIPQLIVLFFVGLAAFVAWVIGFFAVLFTGQWPEGIRNFVVGSMRWALRVNAYEMLLTDEYPPFSLEP